MIVRSQEVVVARRGQGKSFDNYRECVLKSKWVDSETAVKTVADSVLAIYYSDCSHLDEIEVVKH